MLSELLQPSLPHSAILHFQWWKDLGKHRLICTTTLQSLPGFPVAGLTFCLNPICLWLKMTQAYWLKIIFLVFIFGNRSDQLECKMDQDLNFWIVKNTQLQHDRLTMHDCIFKTIHHLNSSWAWAIDAEITTTKKAISGTGLKDKLIYQMVVWPLRGTPTGSRNGPTGISGNSAQENAKSCSRRRITPCTGT